MTNHMITFPNKLRLEAPHQKLVSTGEHFSLRRRAYKPDSFRHYFTASRYQALRKMNSEHKWLFQQPQRPFPHPQSSIMETHPSNKRQPMTPGVETVTPEKAKLTQMPEILSKSYFKNMPQRRHHKESKMAAAKTNKQPPPKRNPRSPLLK